MYIVNVILFHVTSTLRITLNSACENLIFYSGGYGAILYIFLFS